MRIQLFILLQLQSMSLIAQPIVPNIGKMPGKKSSLIISSGTTGTSLGIIIRCKATIQQDNEPLYVIDGVVYEATQIKFLNPNDIESIDILKQSFNDAIFSCRIPKRPIVVITTRKANEKKFVIKDSKDRIGVGFATISATSLKTGDSVSFVANEFGRIETNLLKSLDYKLTVTCAGYTAKQISLREVMKNKYEILLERKVTELKEVTVVGYASSCICTTLRCVGVGVPILTFQKENNESETNKSVKVYPNPVSPSGTINISFPNVKEGLYQIRLTGSSGQLIYSFQKQISNKNQTEQIHLPAHSAVGVYFIQVIDEQKKMVHSNKLIVQ